MKGAHLNRNHNLAFLLEKITSLPLSEFSILMKRLDQCSGLGFSKLTRAQQLLFLKCLELNDLQCSDVIDYINNLQGGK